MPQANCAYSTRGNCPAPGPATADLEVLCAEFQETLAGMARILDGIRAQLDAGKAGGAS